MDSLYRSEKKEISILHSEFKKCLKQLLLSEIEDYVKKIHEAGSDKERNDLKVVRIYSKTSFNLFISADNLDKREALQMALFPRSCSNFIIF